MSRDCQREGVEIQQHVLVLLLAINATMFCLEIVAGILANSTALLADSLDMLADATIYGIALYAVGKPNSAKRKAALTSGIFQGVLGLLVIGEVVRHFLYGSEPTSLAMIMVGAAALGANVSCLPRTSAARGSVSFHRFLVIYGSNPEKGKNHFATTIAGGCQVPSPGGRMEGASVFGQYRRITK